VAAPSCWAAPSPRPLGKGAWPHQPMAPSFGSREGHPRREQPAHRDHAVGSPHQRRTHAAGGTSPTPRRPTRATCATSSTTGTGTARHPWRVAGYPSTSAVACGARITGCLRLSRGFYWCPAEPSCLAPPAWRPGQLGVDVGGRGHAFAPPSRSSLRRRSCSTSRLQSCRHPSCCLSEHSETRTSRRCGTSSLARIAIPQALSRLRITLDRAVRRSWSVSLRPTCRRACRVALSAAEEPRRKR
jgi:hypothetical protein